MAQRLSGTLRITVKYVGEGRYAGNIRAPVMGKWRFSELTIARPHGDWCSHEMYDRAAAVAIHQATIVPELVIAHIVRSGRETYPKVVLGDVRPNISDVYIASDNTVVFRNQRAQREYHAALELLVQRPRLRLVHGGLTG